MIASVCEQYQLPPEKVQSALIGPARASSAGIIVLLFVIFIPLFTYSVTLPFIFPYSSLFFGHSCLFKFL